MKPPFRRFEGALKTVVFLVAGLAAIIFLNHLATHNSALCLGEGCLEPFAIQGSNSEVEHYILTSKRCYMLIDHTFPRDYKHLTWGKFIDSYLSLRYIVDPTYKLIIIPEEGQTGAVIVIDESRFAPSMRERTIGSCEANPKIVSTKAGLVIPQRLGH